MAAPAASTRYVGLDTLRGIAVVRIMLYHFTTRYHELYGLHGTTRWELRPTDFAIPMFFVISGFVIPLTLARCRSVGEFAFLRVTRLYPAFWACVAATFAIVSIFGLPGREVSLRSALFNLTMTPELFGAAWVDGAYWTLSVELAFYAIMAGFWAIGRIDKSALLFIGMALVHGIAERGQVWPQLADLNLFRYAHLFAIGILLHQIKTAPRPWHYVASASVWLVALIDRGPAYLVWIAVFFALTSLSIFADLKIFRIKPLLWFGALSYPLYLLHQNVGYVVLRAAAARHWNPWLGVAAAFGVVLTIAWTVHRFVEQPAMDWARALRKKLKERAAPQLA